jgi:hypothetical protein
MRIDCDNCAVRGAACSGCVVSVLLGPPSDLEWDETEQAAVAALAESGLVPPLQLVSTSGLLACDEGHIARPA